MKNTLVKNHKLFDGDQNEIIKLDFLIDCPCCKNKIHVKMAECQSVFKFDMKIVQSVLSGLKKVEEKKMGEDRFYKIDGLPMCFFIKDCAKCRTSSLGIFRFR
ncbi:hypothetical protein TDB9533_00497 [Thalassocella blandensis]|nr:hypothetical protein TDB9533_00497 [Thalassocella blandensis]